MDYQSVAEYLELRSSTPEQVDMLFVFGTRFAEPAHIAAGCLMKDAARYVVLTGGPSRHLGGQTEAEAHLQILDSYGVSRDRVVVENTSTNTLENVTHAVPKIAERLDLASVQTVTAIVKWRHARQAVMTLKRNLPIQAQYFTLPYEPEISRSDWWVDSESRSRVLKEWECSPRYLDKEDLAEISEAEGGWI